MFVGATGGSFRNESGALRWTFDCRFEALTLQDVHANAAITTDSWLYVINEKEGRYRKPKTNVGGKYLYRKTAFADIVTPPAPPP
jgi:hypothetical protein